jgi:hypothetical protein
MNTKDILAKLLATENLTVVHENVPTASFNVKDRVLTLPQWHDMKDYTYDHLVGHEVGHALYTPEQGLHDAVSDKGKAFKSFLNVVEDARIEKLIQRKYQGLRREFVKSYRKMLAENFFGGDIDDVNEMNLIDRINVYFKCGMSAGVRIEKDEQHWIDEIALAETWEQVVDICERLYTEAKEKQEDQMQNMPSPSEEMVQGEEDDESDDESYDNGYQDAEETEEEESVGEDGDIQESEISQGQETEESEYDDLGEATNPEDELSSKTDQMLRDAIDGQHSMDSGCTTKTYMTTNIDHKQFVKDYKTILNTKIVDILRTSREDPYFPDDQCDEVNDLFESKASKLLKEFTVNNKRTINYLVKEFEMKKSATNYSRSYISKTGVIDPVKMNSYKYNDDIFRKVNIVPDGKNHGMIMYLDWSGSMANDIFKTVEQTLNLVYFCRQVNIPFRVYAFSNAPSESYLGDDDPIMDTSSMPDNTLVPIADFKLVEFFNNKMSKKDFNDMSARLLIMAKYSRYLRNTWRLYGTPLDSTLLVASSVYNEFQRKNPVDIVNTIILTDGISHYCNTTTSYERRDGSVQKTVCAMKPPSSYNIRNKIQRCIITDHITKNSFDVTRKTSTKNLIKLYKGRTGSTVVGYHISPSSKNSFIDTLMSFDKTRDSSEKYYDLFKRNNFANVTGLGYDKYFMIKGGKSLQTSNGSFEVSESAKKGEILRGFRSANKKKLVSRQMLNEFIEEIS